MDALRHGRLERRLTMKTQSLQGLRRIPRALSMAVYVLAVPAVLILGSGSTAFAETLKQSAGDWLHGSGVDIWYSGDNSATCVAISGAPGGSGCAAGTVLAGYKWQCVEMINRQYLTERWTTSTW